ncbi:ABC transporter ATP-binding protein [bacterium]|nr:ABC transporter ATP-binding protein [bacterium]
MIEIRKLKISFNSHVVLSHVDLTIENGDSIVIIGGSGCGKTVLLRSIIGLIKPDAGTIRVNGEEITRMDRKDLFRIRKKFGMLFQGAALFDSMTVEENIGLALKEHTDLSADEIQKRVQEKLNVVGLPGIEEKKPAELSGGMKKRVGLARALIMDPEFVLFDEPTTGLDPVMADAINHLIIETHRKFNITSIVVTHDMSSAYQIADRIAMLHDGRIIFSGPPSAIKKSELTIVKQFVKGSGGLIHGFESS